MHEGEVTHVVTGTHRGFIGFISETPVGAAIEGGGTDYALGDVRQFHL